jgi:hypothetical protein
MNTPASYPVSDRIAVIPAATDSLDTGVDMNKLALTCVVLGTLAASTASTAFAETSPPAADTTSTSTIVAQTGWVSPDATTSQSETREQVYQDLVHAKQDGQLAYLNSTVYAHH